MDGPVVIAVDFDGTCVKHEFPHIGDQIGAFPWLRQFREEGAHLILWTCRTGDPLVEAVDFCKAMGLEFDGVNEHSYLAEGFDPGPKIGAHIYIDDKAAGCFMRYDGLMKHAYVDWDVMGPWIMQRMAFMQIGVLG